MVTIMLHIEIKRTLACEENVIRDMYMWRRVVYIFLHHFLPHHRRPSDLGHVSVLNLVQVAGV